MVPSPRAWLHGPARFSVLAIGAGFLVAALPIGLLAWFSLTAAETSLRREIEAHSLTEARGIASSLESIFQEHAILLQSNAERPRLLQALKGRERAEVLRRLEAMSALDPHIEGLFVAAPDGRLFANHPATPDAWGRDVSDLPAFRGVIEKGGPYVSEIHERLIGAPAFVWAIAVPVRDNGRLLGVLGMLGTLEGFASDLGRLKSETAHLYVVDQKGKIAYHSGKPSAGPPADFSSIRPVREVLAGREGVVEYENPLEKDDPRRISAFAPVRRFGWGVVVETPVEKAFAPIRWLRRFVTIVSALLAVLLGGASALFARSYVRRRIVSDAASGKMAELEEIVAARASRLKAMGAMSQALLACRTVECAADLACRVVVNDIGFRMAWVGLADETTFDVRPVAECGYEEGYLASVKVRWDESPEGMGPTGTAVRTGQPVIWSRILDDPRYAPWREQARSRGYRSSAAFPLLVEDKAIGALSVYWPGDDFPEDEIAILQRIAGDAAQAIHRVLLWERVARGKDEWEKTFDAIHDPIFIHDMQYRILLANRAYQEVSGRPFHDIIGMPYYEVFPRREGPLACCLAARESQEEEEEEISGRVYRFHSYPIFDAESRLASAIHLIEDVTAEKASAEALRESEEKFRGMAGAASDAIILLDDRGRVIFWNDSAGRIFGYSEGEVMGKDAHLLVAPARYQEAFRAGYAAFSATGTGPVVGKTLELDGVRRDGTEFPVELSVSAVRLEGRWHAVGVLRDITERRLTMERLRREMEISSGLVETAGTMSRALDRDRLLSAVPPLAAKLVGSERCSIYLWDRTIEAFVVAGLHGFPAELVPAVRAARIRPKELPIIVEAKAHRAPVPVDDAAASPLFPPGFAERFHLGAVLAAPVMRGEELVGGIMFIHATPHAFAEREIELARGIADQLALALANADLYRETQEKAMTLAHRMETIQVMHEIDRGILSSVKGEEILRTAVQLIGRVVPCDRVTVTLVDREAQAFEVVEGWGLDWAGKGLTVPFDQTDAAEVVRTRRAVSRPDLSLEYALRPLDRRILEDGFRSDIRIPIVVHDEVAAVLSLGSRRVGAFAPDDLVTGERVAAQIGVALENARLVEDLEGLFLGTVQTLAAAIDAKSPWTQGHSERVTEYGVLIGREMGLSEKEIRDLRLAGLLHDIGKIGTYEFLLDKPEKLTPEESEIVKAHPVKGAEILAPIKQFKDVIPGVKYHHEKWDGTGYPDGLNGEAIPLFGRILAVADTYDAIMADRPYRKSPGQAWAVEEIRRCAGTQFDPKIADTFVGLIERGDLGGAAQASGR